jgi:hypothetical protein
VFSHKPVKLQNTAYDLNTFEKSHGDSDLPDHFYYTNKQEGFGFETQNVPDRGGQMITGFLYGPSVSDLALKCRRA